MSKTPVREALLQLEADGLVKLEPYQGATVTWLSIDEYEELMFIQDALEVPALTRVVERATASEFAMLERLLGKMRGYRDDHDSRGFFEQSAVMHERMFAIARLPRLVHVVMGLVLHPTRRYERVFMHQFDDAWDIEMGIIAGRMEGVAARDAAAAAERVQAGRSAMLELVRGRLEDPRIAPYLAPRVDVRPRRMSRMSRTARRDAAARVLSERA